MKTVIFIIVAACGIVNAYAQESTTRRREETFLVGYQVASAQNSGYLSTTTWRGGMLEYRRLIKPNISVGVGAGWNTFEEYFPRTTKQKEDGTGAITSDLIRNIYTVPITANAHYYFDAAGKLKPYIGLGLGTQFKDERHFANIYQFSSHTWGFLMKPEVGVMAEINSELGLFLNASYNYDTSGSDIFTNQKDWQHFAFTLGLAF